MVRYAYSCGHCGDIEIVKPMAEASRRELCPACGSALRRVYTAPITDCLSFGRDQFYERTPEWRWRPKNDDQERQFRDLAHNGEATQPRVTFGAGRSTGS